MLGNCQSSRRYESRLARLHETNHTWAVNTLPEAMRLDSYTEPQLDDGPRFDGSFRRTVSIHDTTRRDD